METNKFEQQSREKFEEREMQPSIGAWGKLEQLLDEAQPQKKKKAFPWFAIAASFVGIAIVATFFFNQDTTENNFVEQDTTSEILKTETPVIIKTLKTEQLVEMQGDNTKTKNKDVTENLQTQQTLIKGATNQVIAATVAKREDQKNNQIKKTNFRSKESLINKKGLISNKEENVATIAASKTTAQKDQMSIISEEKRDELLKTTISQNETIAQVNSLEVTKPIQVKDDIDSLLKKAQNKLQKERIISPEKADAMALLGDVEFEIKRTFRDKIFYAIGEGYDYVKTTIETRND